MSLEGVLGLVRSRRLNSSVAAIQKGDSKEPAPPASDLGVNFINVARESGLNVKTIFGGEHKNKYLLETTGCGIAFYDYDNDGWLDIFIVNGSRLEGFPSGNEPISHLFRNNRDGTFTDVTAKAGVAHSGWGQGVCIGDYDNDGWDDLFVTYYGKNVLYHNNGDGTFTDVSQKAGVAGKGTRWNTGCAFVDYDRDGRLDLFVANYIDMDLATAPVPESGPCLYKGVMVACGPPGLQGGKNILYHNNGDGTFTDVSEAAGIFRANGTYGLGVLTADFDNDGWPDIYVANDSTASALYHNKKNGTFEDIAIEAGCALSPDGKPQAGMGVSAADYDLDGNLDLVKTNFAGDTPSLYHNIGGGTFEDATFTAGLGAHTQFLGWGCGFFDFDNDGNIDVAVNTVNDYPQLLRCTSKLGNNWIKVRTIGTKSNRSGIGARLTCITHPAGETKPHQQIDEVRSGGSYISQNDLRIHFGLGKAEKVDLLEIRWPSGQVDTLKDVKANQLIYVKEGAGIFRTMQFPANPMPANRNPQNK